MELFYIGLTFEQCFVNRAGCSFLIKLFWQIGGKSHASAQPINIKLC